MFDVVKSGEDLEGKKIKYCNIMDRADCDESNMIVTEDNKILFFDIDCNHYITKCFSEKGIKSRILYDGGVKNELMSCGLLTEELVQEIKLEKAKNEKEKEDILKQERYKKYLELKEEFEK